MQKDACGAMLLFQVVVQSLHLKAIWGTHLSAPPAVGKGSLRAFCVRNGKQVQEVCSSTACVSCGGATNILHLVDENNKTPWLHQVLRAAFASWAVLAWFLLVFSCTNCTMFECLNGELVVDVHGHAQCCGSLCWGWVGAHSSIPAWGWCMLC